MTSAPAGSTAGIASIVRGDGEAAFVIVLADEDDRDAFAASVADDLAVRPECRVAIVATNLAAIDPGAMAEMLRGQAPDRARMLVIGHGPGAEVAVALAREMDAATLLIAPARTTQHDISGAPSLHVAVAAITAAAGAEGLEDWLGQIATLDARRLPLPREALPVALRQSGAMGNILTAMINGEPVPDLSGLIADWHRRHAYRIELAGTVQCAASGEWHLRGRIINTGETTFVFGRQERDRLLIGARIKARGEAAWTSEARAAPAHSMLEPGDSGRFVMGLTPPHVVAASVLELSLVSEGSFWYCDLGFPALRLGNAASDDRSPQCGTAPADARQEALGPERATFERATLDDLWNCYRLILGREPDPEGLSYYTQLVQAGMTRDDLVSTFIRAPEGVARIRGLGQPKD